MRRSLRPLSYLPRSWRLRETEEATLDALVGVASRRLKVQRNLLKFGVGENVEAYTLAINALDSVRRRR